MTIVIGESVNVDVVIPPILVVEVDIPAPPLVTVLYPNVVVMVEGPTTPVISIPALPGPPGEQGETGEPGEQGPPGESGEPGTTGGSFIFIQPIAEESWDIIHDLTYTPNVIVVDSAGTVMFGDVNVLSPTHLTISFSIPVLGFAYLS